MKTIATHETNYKPVVVLLDDQWEDDPDYYIGFKDSHEYGAFCTEDLEPLLKDLDALTIALQFCDFVEWYDPFNGVDGSDSVPWAVKSVQNRDFDDMLEELQRDLEIMIDCHDNTAMIDECKRLISLLSA